LPRAISSAIRPAPQTCDAASARFVRPIHPRAGRRFPGRLTIFHPRPAAAGRRRSPPLDCFAAIAAACHDCGLVPRFAALILAPFLAPLLACACAAAPPPPPAPAAPAASPSASPGPMRASDLGAWIDAYASAFGKQWGEGYAFSGYVAVVEDGKIVFGKAYGKANREKGVAATTSTRFRIASLTKQFTAAAILKLVEQGKLRLDDPVRKHLPETPALWEKVTIHHLLTHTSGVSTYTMDAELMKDRDKRHTPAEVIARLRDRPLDFEPGARFQYSNSGYLLLGMVIQRVSGTPYEAYLQEHVLGPAGMTHTSTVDAPDAPDAAVGYTVDEDDAMKPAQSIDMSLPFAAGALRSTVDDLVAWDRALSGSAVLREESKERMFTVEKESYAYGVNRSQIEGHDVLSHSGNIDGFTAYFARALDRPLAVIALSNNDHFEAHSVGRAALKMALAGKRESPPEERAVVPFDAGFAARVAGEYRLTETSRKALEAKIPKEIIDSAMGMTISIERDRLFMKPSGQQRVRVFRGSDGALFTKQDPLELALEPAGDTGAAVTGVTLKQGGLAGRYERAPRDAAAPAGGGP
jgi:CubicO group peptidase (beta-lactamase class C family)